MLLARILRPRGNKGEVAAELLTDFPERIAKLREVFVGDAGGNTEPRVIALKNFWLSQNHIGQGVFHFEGCASINDAEKFRGLGVLLPFDQRVTLPAGKYFVSDLVGCSVCEQGASSEKPLGIVQDVQFTGEGVSGTPVLEVRTSRGELLIPLAEDICTLIDVPARRIEVALPEGLRELNRE